MTEWTLGQVKARNMALEAYCQGEGCNHFYTFDLDKLIAAAGPDYAVPEFIDEMPCPQCGGRLKVMLAMIHPDGNGV